MDFVSAGKPGLALSSSFSSSSFFFVRVEDFEAGAFETCYLLDFVGPKRFAIELSHIVPRYRGFTERLFLHPVPSNHSLFVNGN